MRCPTVFVALVAIAICAAGAQGQEEIPSIERRLPPTGGLELPSSLKEAIDRRLRDYEDRLDEITDHPLAADVGALAKAVRFAVQNREFYDEKQFPLAEELLDLADARFKELEETNTSSWTEEKGLVVRGYRSTIDDSYQPFGLEIPESLDLSKPVPLLVWLHGRGDKTTDIHFLDRCSKKNQALGGFIKDQQQCIVLHPFGRQCVGWKHAGEIDIFEAIETVSREYPIDPARVALAGFSMGGAGAWHVGAHYRDQFCAVHTGAGFAETARYNNLKPEDFPPDYEQVLWRLYDVPNYARNFLNGPLLAYSGEIDKQKQAADLMEEALKAEGLEMLHVIGKGMGHKYDQPSVEIIWNWLMDSWEAGNPVDPESVILQTQTLRYPEHHWLRLTGLKKHWEDTRAEAKWDRDAKAITVKTKNVAALELQRTAGTNWDGYTVTIDGQEVRSEETGLSIDSAALFVDGGKWHWGEPGGLRKEPGLQGPIDDAFMSRFLVVPPDEQPANPSVARWVNFELAHFRKRWRELMRGEFLEKSSDRLDSNDMRDCNLILWGDPGSNAMIAEIVEKLPIEWTEESITFRGKKYDAGEHMPVFVFPNPVNPERYVVINSGLTFREGHDRTNSLQNPKLPDWAVIGLDRDPDELAPGRVVDAGFFDETWK